MKFLLGAFLLIVAIVVTINILRAPPAAERIALRMFVNGELDTVEYEGVRYAIGLGSEINRRGDVRYIGRAYTEFAPIVLTEAVLTTGDFSNPAIVDISPLQSGNLYWESSTTPTGTLTVMHLIPLDVSVYHAINAVKSGDQIELVGREDLDNRIENSNGRFFRVDGKEHRLMLVTEVRKL